MKFFTLEAYNAWYEAYEEDGALLNAWNRYKDHLGELRGVLRESVLKLADPYGMEDGLVVRVDHDRERRVLKLVLRCGHLQMGYYDLELTYIDASIIPEHEKILASIARSTKSHRTHQSDLAYHELDATEDGRIEHRFLFHPGKWFEIRCGLLQWDRLQRHGRSFPYYKDRYAGGPSSADP